MAESWAKSALLVCVCAWIWVGAAHSEQAADVCELAHRLKPTIERLRGLPFKRPVPCKVRSREQIRLYLRQVILEKIPEAKLKGEELAYKMIGLLPRDFQYQAGLIALYESQLGGFYDPDEEYFAMASWIPAALQNAIIVHELTHAIEDQYYALEKFVDPRLDNSDLLLARLSLAEGDASHTTMRYEAETRGAALDSLSIAELPVRSDFPAGIQLMMNFPYKYGTEFVRALWKHGGQQEIDRAFTRPPRSSAEIMDPASYLKGAPTIASGEELLAALEPPPGGTALYNDVVGRYGIMAVCAANRLPDTICTHAGEGWRGDEIVIFREGAQLELVWRLAFENAVHAEQFKSMYSQVLARSEYRGEIRTTEQECVVRIWEGKNGN